MSFAVHWWRAPRLDTRVRLVLGVLFWSGLFVGAVSTRASAGGGHPERAEVYYVTSLEDYAGSDGEPVPGTLRYGIQTARGPRVILFRVGGYVRLKAPLEIERPGIVIAGQTAPGQGVCLRDHPLIIRADDVRVSHIRVRLGTNNLQVADALTVARGTNVVIEHCSVSWSVDETLSATWRVAELMVRWCFITESLNRSIHTKGAHGCGSLIRPSVPTVYHWHHNLYAHHPTRNPRLGSYTPGLDWTMDFRNNVVYNWGYRAGYSGPTNEAVKLNYVGNVLVKGPSTTHEHVFYGGGATTLIYQRANLVDFTLDGMFNPRPAGWACFDGAYVSSETEFPVPGGQTEPPEAAFLKVLVLGGAKPWARDAVDRRIANEVLAGTGRIIDSPEQVGGWPALAGGPVPTDSDGDGLPDYWEQAFGLNPSGRTDGSTAALAKYLDWLSGPHAVCAAGRGIELDLAEVFGGVTNLVYTVSEVTAGSARLDRQGWRLRFEPPSGYAGLVTVGVGICEPRSGIRAGPIPIRILVVPETATDVSVIP